MHESLLYSSVYSRAEYSRPTLRTDIDISLVLLIFLRSTSARIYTCVLPKHKWFIVPIWNDFADVFNGQLP